MKKIFILCLSLFVVTNLFASIFVDGIWYDFNNSNRTASVTNQENYAYSGSIVIPEKVTYNNITYSVTTIGRGAFYWCEGLTSITIPNSVTTIEEVAFHLCTSLTSVTIPNSVTTIGRGAFFPINNIIYNGTATGLPWGAKCVNGYVDKYLVYSDVSKTTLCGYFTAASREITIPNSVTTIKECAFFSYRDLISITIPNSVTTIGERAFAWCHNLTSIIIPNSVTTIGNGVFTNCSSLTSITIPNSVTTIGDGVFTNCSSLTSITIPNSVTTIGDYAFEYCRGLTSITIPNSVTTIGDYAFNDCSGLTSVILLNPNVKIEESAFIGCTIIDLYCGTNVDLSNVSSKIKNIHRLGEEELQYAQPFDQYAKGFVEQQINEWQKKGEFEKTTDWQKRVTETTRKQKTDSLVFTAKKNYLIHYQKNNNPTFTLGTYDADNEVYLVQSNSGEDLLVAIPISEAPYVKQNWSSCIATPHYGFADTDVVLMSVDFTFPNKKTYTYKSTYAKQTTQTISHD